MSGGETDGEEESPEALVVARVMAFDEDDGNVVEAPDDYATNFDEELGSAVAESLCNYLVNFAAENDSPVVFKRDNNEIDGQREDGSSLSISCFTPQLFDLQRWPSHEETSEAGKIVFDLVGRLNADFMITLARRFIINGHLED
ncbi:hypothetical protein EV667_1788 [Ancylobacter aquaticus]|uniref:Uncharacterized protein n=1 Tax=Ancylobacter aquaticus TaxID=100 RepID=A0A4R1I8A4_ANCAQ|nr:hypothetical protein [Ancylobacter aquaticus]TCK31677.1 hypothetical protein EV667_1788 [Ancylobacter aquaticus]